METQLKYSQNYLWNKSLVSYLIKLSDVSKQDRILEIGPGRGIITQELLRSCKSVYAIEKDIKLVHELKEKLSRLEALTLAEGDFLKIELPKDAYKVFSNIPFSITSDILKKLLLDKNPPKECYLIMQEEAFRKFSGQPYGPETMMSLILKSQFSFDLLHTFKQTDFTPTPRVSIVFVKITQLEQTGNQEGLSLHNSFRDFVAYGFIEHGPGLKKAFDNIFSHSSFKGYAKEFLFTEDARPTDLTYVQWKKLFHCFLSLPENVRNRISASYEKVHNMQKNLSKSHRTRKY